MAYAHSSNPEGDWHDLIAHLRGTSTRARAFASVFGGAEAAAALGFWHDLGKFHPAWQSYLARAAAQPQLRGTGPEHKLAGALLASRETALGPLAIAIAGHHGGLPALADLKSRLTESEDLPAAEEALRLAQAAIPDLAMQLNNTAPQAIVEGGRRVFEHYIRMVFSALVDADFLDTEEHFDATRTTARQATATTPQALLDRLMEDQQASFGGRTGAIAEARRAIFEACLDAADLPPGMFRLTVPTGGGKTRAGLAFALRHAAVHGLRRVIVAVPFVSITEQTADVYRGIFASLGAETVLEHHSGFQESGVEEDAGASVIWSRLAAENWDAPIVVTTTVQLLQSLFAHRPSRVRKLHRIAGSVIVLDEVQSLPPRLLDATLEMLRDLTRYYGVTVVLSTATQPAFDVLPVFADAQATDIVSDPGRWYDTLRRVEYDVRTAPRQSWDEVAGWLRAEQQALAVLNTRADAIALLEALDDPAALHLSTLLCGAHRRAAIEEIRRRLKDKEPCIVISTQVVEAGVDLDFPAVYRALGPLDAIVQAAGRCNREGTLDRGRVVIFDPIEGGIPGGSYRPATDQAKRVLNEGGTDLDQLDVLERYYRGLLPLLATDPGDIQGRRDAFDYPEVAARYQLIEDDTEAVVITTYGTDAQRQRVAGLLDDARAARGNPRRILREMQPYIVSVRRREVERLRALGTIEPVSPGLGIWRGEYDPVMGLVAGGESPLLMV